MTMRISFSYGGQSKECYAPPFLFSPSNSGLLPSASFGVQESGPILEVGTSAGGKTTWNQRTRPWSLVRWSLIRRIRPS